MFPLQLQTALESWRSHTSKPMKTTLLFTALLAAVFGLRSSDCEGPNAFQPQTIDIDGDGFVDVRYLEVVSVWSAPPLTKDTIRYLAASTRFLHSPGDKSYFVHGQMIPPTNKTQVVEGINLTEHLAIDHLGFTECVLPDDQRYWNGLTNGIAAYRFVRAGGVLNYGWIRLARPNLETSSRFTVVDHDWNPLPGKPIRAGMPPEIPLTASLSSEGLRLTWPTAVASWKLEWSDQFGGTAVWHPVPDAGSSEALLPVPETNRFYRIRKP